MSQALTCASGPGITAKSSILEEDDASYFDNAIIEEIFQEQYLEQIE